MSSDTHHPSSVDPDKVWIYHERQQALLCGQHALNNLAQSATAFNAVTMANIAQQLDAIELRFMADNNEGGIMSPDYQRRLAEGSHHVDAQGNFSIEVLKAAIQNKYGIQLPHLSAKDLQSNSTLDITDYQGFLCHKSDHWFAIRKIGGRFWNLNSTLERPEVISHFTLATEISRSRNEGYTIFCVPDGLPHTGTTKPSSLTANSYGRWHRMSDLLRGKSTDENSFKDPWENVGSGMRLDGKKSGASSLASSLASDGILEDLSEEEQLQLALQFSLEAENYQHQQVPTSTTTSIVRVPPEPTEGTAGAIKIRFRLPNNKIVVRRFLQSDPVTVVPAYVNEQCGPSNNGQTLELIYGYPPKDLLTTTTGQQITTIGDAKLANESIQCRYR